VTRESEKNTHTPPFSPPPTHPPVPFVFLTCSVFLSRTMALAPDEQGKVYGLRIVLRSLSLVMLLLLVCIDR
jgi:hypothetical protein